MKILALVANENTYQPRVYDSILKARHKDFVGIALVPFTTRAKPTKEMAKFLFDLYGPIGFVRKSLQVVKAKVVDKLSKFTPVNARNSIESVAASYDVPIIYTDNINGDNFLAKVAELKPDVILSSQGHFVGKKLRELPRHGILNKHAGMLPKYRGAYPVFWAMLNGEKEIGITVHFMAKELDGGEIICQQLVPIRPEDTFESMYQKVIEWTPRLFLQALNELENGNAEFTPNPDHEATSYPFPTRADVRQFRTQGLRIW